TEDPVSNSEAGKYSEEISATGITITTTAAKYLTSVSATTGGTVTSTKTIKERGVCYATTTKPTIASSVVVSGAGTGTYESVITGLAANTKYYVRAYVKYGAGKVAYGTQTSFTTLQSYGTVTDADGNEYATVTIGNQVWMAENLRTTKYNDGTDIPNVTAVADWITLTSGAYCSFDNDDANVADYGLLYNWYAVDDTRGIAPTGWHVPTDDEYRTLMNYFGGTNGSNVAGAYLKQAGLDYWLTPNEGANSGSGFEARGNGARFYTVVNTVPGAYFSDFKRSSPWWTADETNDSAAKYRQCNSASTQVYRFNYLGHIRYLDKRSGYALRLVKD
ncbi:MAG: hypothetical protein EHM43_00050, partial [Ignavibacteriae bacterium]